MSSFEWCDISQDDIYIQLFKYQNTTTFFLSPTHLAITDGEKANLIPYLFAIRQ